MEKERLAELKIQALDLGGLDSDRKAALATIVEVDSCWIFIRIISSISEIARYFWDVTNNKLKGYYLDIAKLCPCNSVSNDALLKLTDVDNMLDVIASGNVTRDAIDKCLEDKIGQEKATELLRSKSRTVASIAYLALIDYVDYDKELFTDLLKFFSDGSDRDETILLRIYAKMLRAGDGYELFYDRKSYGRDAIDMICAIIKEGNIAFDDQFLVNILGNCREYCESLPDRLEPIIGAIKDKTFAITELVGRTRYGCVFEKLIDSVDSIDTLNKAIPRILYEYNINHEQICRRTAIIFRRIAKLGGGLTTENKLTLYELRVKAKIPPDGIRTDLESAIESMS